MGGGADAHATVPVVEDQLGDCFESVLTSPYTVERAENGGGALSGLDDTVDVVLLDRRMPDISGDRVPGRIDSHSIDCRAAMVTAVNPDFDVIDMDFDDYLTKPVRPETLEETVERLLALNEYGVKYRELSSKLVKKNILEIEKTPAELKDSSRFAELQRRIEQLEAELER